MKYSTQKCVLDSELAGIGARFLSSRISINDNVKRELEEVNAHPQETQRVSFPQKLWVRATLLSHDVTMSPSRSRATSQRARYENKLYNKSIQSEETTRPSTTSTCRDAWRGFYVSHPSLTLSELSDAIFVRGFV